MQAALCQRRPESETCVALFSRETAAQLAPSADDTIHVYPPWQSLTVDGERHPIILNTHFSQKVVRMTKQDNSGTCLKVLGLKEKTKPYPLTRCLWKREENFKSSQAFVANKQPHMDVGSASESLLEALDTCGTTGSVCGPVEVVVQRIYSDSVTQFPHTSLLRYRTLSKCLSETVKQQHFSRCAQLFSLIDSLWPPAVPLHVPGEGSCDQTVKASAAPSFCYRLAGQRDCVLAKRESPLYRPPFIQTLREILQDEPVSRRCSFKGTLVYKRELDKEENDLLMFVTDSSLQDEKCSESTSRTLPVYVSSTSLLQTSVRQAVAALTPRFRPRLVFRDAVIERGKVTISRQSVVRPDSEPSENQNISSRQRVLLDRLSPESPPCSLCTVTGVVMDIDENSAFSWPVCCQCGGEHLEAHVDRQDVFSCAACGIVDKPSRKMQLEVFLSCSSSSHWTVKVKLQQNSIMSLLDSTGNTQGYEVEAVLGKSIGPLNAFIHVVTRSSTLWMALEEITL